MRKQFIPCIAWLVVSIGFLNLSAEIFDGKRKLLLLNYDSHYTAGHLRKILSKENKDHILVKRLPETKVRHFPIGFNENLEHGYPYLRSVSSAMWFESLEKKIEALKESEACESCEVILTYCSHGMGSHHNHETNSPLSSADSYLIGDTSDVYETEKVLEALKWFADGLRAKGVDYVIFSTGALSYYRSRLVDHNGFIAREFNRRYKHLNYYFANTIDYLLERPRIRMGGGLDHAMRLGPGNVTFIYGKHFYEAMLELDNKPLPTWWGEFEREKENVAWEEVHKVQYFTPLSGQYKLGDTITVKFDAQCDPVNLRSIDIKMNFIRRDDQLNTHFPNATSASLLKIGEKCPKGNGPEEKFSLDAEAGSWCCGEDMPDKELKWGEYKIPVTKSLFKQLIGEKGVEYLKDKGLPVYIQVHQPSTYLPRRDYSHIDWKNPENMIVLFNSQQIPSKPIVYPKGFNRSDIQAISSLQNQKKSSKSNPSYSFFRNHLHALNRLINGKKAW